MFITFEGIDGCGKSTQIMLLKNFLEKLDYEVITLREPGGTELSEKIRSILLEHNYKLSSITELLLFEAARNNLVETIIKPALDEGKIVLSDRFYDSTTAYQGYGRGLSIEMIKNINNIATQGIKPDVTFYLDLDLKEAENRSKNKNKDRIENSGEEFFSKVRQGFKQLAIEEKDRIILIDSSKDINNTHIEITKHVKNLLTIIKKSE